MSEKMSKDVEKAKTAEGEIVKMLDSVIRNLRKKGDDYYEANRRDETVIFWELESIFQELKEELEAGFK